MTTKTETPAVTIARLDKQWKARGNPPMSWEQIKALAEHELAHKQLAKRKAWNAAVDYSLSALSPKIDTDPQAWSDYAERNRAWHERYR